MTEVETRDSSLNWDVFVTPGITVETLDHLIIKFTSMYQAQYHRACYRSFGHSSKAFLCCTEMKPGGWCAIRPI